MRRDLTFHEASEHVKGLPLQALYLPLCGPAPFPGPTQRPLERWKGPQQRLCQGPVKCGYLLGAAENPGPQRGQIAGLRSHDWTCPWSQELLPHLPYDDQN